MRYVAHGYFAYVNEISFAYTEHLVHGSVAGYLGQTNKIIPIRQESERNGNLLLAKVGGE